jgi:hypothetical protein
MIAPSRSLPLAKRAQNPSNDILTLRRYRRLAANSNAEGSGGTLLNKFAARAESDA